MEKLNTKPTELIKCGLLQLSDFPQSWMDPKWRVVSFNYGLNDVEMTELWAQVARQNEIRKKGKARLRIEDGHMIVKLVHKRAGYTVNMLPKDVTDERWPSIQQASKLRDTHITALIYYIATQNYNKELKLQEQKFKEGCAIGRWMDPVEKGDRSAPYTFLRRRRVCRKLMCDVY